MEKIRSPQLWIHLNMAAIGGFLGAFTVLSFQFLLGSAQTSNLIEICLSLLEGDWWQLLIRVAGMLLYMAAIVIVVCLRKKPNADLRMISIVVDAVAVLILGCFPADIYPILGLLPLYFSMAMQWNSFPQVCGFFSATVFSTNNFRQLVIGLTEYFGYHNRKELKRVKVYGSVLLAFHIGAVAGFLLWVEFSMRAAWFCLILLAVAAIQVMADRKRSPIQPCGELGGT